MYFVLRNCWALNLATYRSRAHAQSTTMANVIKGQTASSNFKNAFNFFVGVVEGVQIDLHCLGNSSLILRGKTVWLMPCAMRMWASHQVIKILHLLILAGFKLCDFPQIRQFTKLKPRSSFLPYGSMYSNMYPCVALPQCSTTAIITCSKSCTISHCMTITAVEDWQWGYDQYTQVDYSPTCEVTFPRISQEEGGLEGSLNTERWAFLPACHSSKVGSGLSILASERRELRPSWPQHPERVEDIASW